ncbi:MAG: sigma-54 dependent transcriptional regulator [Aestuariivita sp.]|nr:sigma-54 dependent transcriptional regulator [Aestuariivita sp.]
MAPAIKIAIIDDEQDTRQSISQWLVLSGYDTKSYPRAEDALEDIGSGYPGIVISDLKMPGMNGISLLKELKTLDRSLPVIMVTGHGDVPLAVEAIKLGAFDFLEKPFDPDRLLELTLKATNARRLTLNNRALRHELSDKSQLIEKFLGSSAAMVQLREDILDLGQADGNVLIEGETGTGKTLVAHALHAVGSRASKKFLLIQCSAFNQSSLSERLFGAIKDADAQLPAVDEVRGGTLILEDIECLGNELQARLLGHTKKHGMLAKTRIIAVCNTHEKQPSCQDLMRPDLFFRLAAQRLTIPPLRQRGEDIILMFNKLNEQFAEEYGCEQVAINSHEESQILHAPWPGNVRQLINFSERAVLQSRRGDGTIASLLLTHHEEIQPTLGIQGKPLKESVEAFESMLIENTMRRHKGSIVGVMDELCLPRRTLNEKMTKYGLQRSNYT